MRVYMVRMKLLHSDLVQLTGVKAVIEFSTSMKWKIVLSITLHYSLFRKTNGVGQACQ